jgi:hypothetical protein
MTVIRPSHLGGTKKAPASQSSNGRMSTNGYCHLNTTDMLNSVVGGFNPIGAMHHHQTRFDYVKAGNGGGH